MILSEYMKFIMHFCVRVPTSKIRGKTFEERYRYSVSHFFYCMYLRMMCIFNNKSGRWRKLSML